jgi:hypothetical protein
VIDLETRLLEMLDWDEQRLEKVYERAARFIEKQKISDKGTLERALVEHLRTKIPEEGARLIFSILDQNIRRQMRIIEE